MLNIFSNGSLVITYTYKTPTSDLCVTFSEKDLKSFEMLLKPKSGRTVVTPGVLVGYRKKLFK